MKELVEILLDNALKHADKRNAIEVELKSEGNNIILRIKDTIFMLYLLETENMKVLKYIV